MEQAEKEAIRRLKEGDIGGLETLVRLYQLKAVRAAYLITHDRGLAEDLTQAAFVRAYERIAQFDDSRPFGPWFLRSVINDALKAVSRVTPGVSLESPGTEALFLEDSRPGPEEMHEQAEIRHTIGEALNSLSPALRTAVVLRYYLGFSEAEVARQLDCPPGTIKWRLHTARERLQELLKGLKPAKTFEKQGYGSSQTGGKTDE
ncbi:MAG TPA: sigma-70 family RNA polymerase sigma factor [Chloroflexia bacterium]|nr:sigma-70 family RNA polymerase sigma factor [Chloroflexia bacterium]